MVRAAPDEFVGPDGLELVRFEPGRSRPPQMPAGSRSRRGRQSSRRRVSASRGSGGPASWSGGAGPVRSRSCAVGVLERVRSSRDPWSTANLPMNRASTISRLTLVDRSVHRSNKVLTAERSGAEDRAVVVADRAVGRARLHEQEARGAQLFVGCLGCRRSPPSPCPRARPRPRCPRRPRWATSRSFRILSRSASTSSGASIRRRPRPRPHRSALRFGRGLVDSRPRRPRPRHRRRRPLGRKIVVVLEIDLSSRSISSSTSRSSSISISSSGSISLMSSSAICRFDLVVRWVTERLEVAAGA